MTDKPKAPVAESAIESLKPGSQPVSDPKSKVEAMAAILGQLGKMPSEELCKLYNDMISQYPSAAFTGAPGDAGANRSTQNMHPSKAEGSAGPLAPQPMVKLAKEEVDKLFGESTLTEEAREKVSTLFEAAVNGAIAVEVARLEEAYEAKRVEEITEFIEQVKEDLDGFADYTVDKWLKDNEVAIVDSLRLENAEDFMNGLKNLFLESYIDVPEERLDVVKEMADKVANLEASLNEAISENVALKRSQSDAEKSKTFDTVAEGLTLVDKEKLKTLSESIDFTSADEYSRKVKIIKDQYFKEGKDTKETSGSVTNLTEEAAAPETPAKAPVTTSADPFIAAAQAQLKNMAR